MNTLIDTAQLAELLHDDLLVVFDCRFSLANVNAGEQAYRAGHIPGARYVNLDMHLSAPVVPGKTGRHPLPSRETFARTLGEFGVTNRHRIVAYDDASGAFAARLWWMVRWLGHPDVAVLDGGFAAWQEAGLPVTEEVTRVAPAEFIPRGSLTRLVTADELLSSGKLLLDARDAARYRGQNETIDPVAGHIPGAISAPFMDNHVTNSHAKAQRMKPLEELRDRFRSLGVVSGEDAICYCGSGVTATVNILAMTHAGFGEPALYAGSWSEWITDPDRPVATHDD